MYKICFKVPMQNKEEVKQAMFNAGGGRLGAYDQCSFEIYGRGQFRPLDGSQPAIGQQNQLEIVEEAQVDMVCQEKFLKATIEALKQAHPYETPAYDVTKLEDI